MFLIQINLPRQPFLRNTLRSPNRYDGSNSPGSGRGTWFRCPLRFATSPFFRSSALREPLPDRFWGIPAAPRQSSALRPSAPPVDSLSSDPFAPQPLAALRRGRPQHNTLPAHQQFEQVHRCSCNLTNPRQPRRAQPKPSVIALIVSSAFPSRRLLM